MLWFSAGIELDLKARGDLAVCGEMWKSGATGV